MRLSSVIASLAGIGLAAALIWYFGVADIAHHLGDAWVAVLAISAFRLLPLALDAHAWNLLFAPADRRPALFMLEARWICESVNTLLPVAQIGGDVVRARLAGRPFTRPDGTLHPGSSGGTSVLVDYLFGHVTQVAFILIAVLLLMVPHGGAGSSEPGASWEGPALIAILGVLLAQWLLLRALRRNMVQRVAARLARLGGPMLAALGPGGGAERLDLAIAATLARRSACGSALAIKLGAHVVRAGEVWIVFQAIGLPIGLAEALILEGLVSLVRSAGFMIPGALGIQEGGTVAVAAMLGIGPEPALAFALIRRGRELLTCLPGIIAWGRREAGAIDRLLGRRQAAHESGSNAPQTEPQAGVDGRPHGP